MLVARRGMFSYRLTHSRSHAKRARAIGAHGKAAQWRPADPAQAGAKVETVKRAHPPRLIIKSSPL